MFASTLPPYGDYYVARPAIILCRRIVSKSLAALKSSAYPDMEMGLDESMDALRALTDPTRVRLLAVLEDDELTVAVLQRVLDVPQSRVSPHLARLKEAGLALDRTDGPHRYYRRAQGSMPAAARAAWTTVSQQIAGDPQLQRDQARRQQVL